MKVMIDGKSIVEYSHKIGMRTVNVYHFRETLVGKSMLLISRKYTKLTATTTKRVMNLTMERV